MDDSPGPEVRALLGCGALWAGLGCEEACKVGPTLVWYLLWARATEEEPSASAAAVPWTAVGAGEAVVTAEAHAAGTLGPALAATVGEAPAAGELRPATSMAPGVEVPTGGVRP